MPPFVPARQRKTRFVTVVDLKGGVGKAALSGCPAACFGLDPKPRRVLLIDLDFRGTLSDAAVDEQVSLIQRQHGAFVNRLLVTPAPDGALVGRLALPMAGVVSAKVILAVDTLDVDEFQVQAEFFVDPKQEARYRFRGHLHQMAVFDAFDLVIFERRRSAGDWLRGGSDSERP